MSWDYSENILVQESAGYTLENELGWDVIFAYNEEKLGKDGTLGRNSYHEILLQRELKAALVRLNPWLTDTQTTEIISELQSTLSSQSIFQINEDKYKLIRDGIKVLYKKPEGGVEERTAQLIDFNESYSDNSPKKNHFLAVKELKIHGDLYRRRTDIVGFVNGIPLLFVELKRNDVDVEDAYTKNYTDYQDTIPQLFYYNAFLMLSNGLEAKVGTLGSKYEFFHEWKRLKEDDKGEVDLETMLKGICKKETFLDLLENFILYDHSNGKNVKILSRNHQYLGVNEAVQAYEERKLRNGKLGVFWHTQGSGKSYSMLFLSGKIRRKFQGSPTIVILTDRDELNDQISDLFLNCGLLGNVTKATNFLATSAKDLITRLQGNPSFIFTLIQKFNIADVIPIYPDHDVIIMSDEAHRSQYGIYAENMFRLLPTASRIGFTGTPLLSDDNITERTFGGYVSIYDFKRAVEDHATVPLYYENRGEKISDLKNPKITDQILQAIEDADLDPSQQEKLEREFAKEIHLLTADARLDAIAKDFVYHYTDLWTSGKAMFVCINKVTCVRMYNLAQKYWAQVIEETKQEIKHSSQQEVQELNRKLKWLEDTEMAVVISQEQNEIKTFEKWGLDIAMHRKKMEKRALDKEYKDSANPLRIVFVCAMWLTGFDVKSLSCLYLDKPLKAHTLMQTIARANRVNEGKSNGLIIDYIGIVKALQKALADYTKTGNGGNGRVPTVDKAELIKQIYLIMTMANDFLNQHQFSLQELIDAKGFKKLSLLKNAANIMSETLEIKKAFQTFGYELHKFWKYINKDDISSEGRQQKDAIIAIYSELQKKRKHADNTDLMVEINHIINEHVVVLENEKEGTGKKFDISKIDFDLLGKEFARSREKNLVLHDLEELVKERIDKLLRVNPDRINYYEKYQSIITAYNSDQDKVAIEKTFMDLMALANSLDSEQKRYVKEGFQSDEELALYDMLFSENLTKEDIKAIKKVSSDLLQKVKSRIAELSNWTDKQDTKAVVDNLIRDTLWKELPSCYDDVSISKYRQQIFEYVYTRYRYVG